MRRSRPGRRRKIGERIAQLDLMVCGHYWERTATGVRQVFLLTDDTEIPGPVLRGRDLPTRERRLEEARLREERKRARLQQQSLA